MSAAASIIGWALRFNYVCCGIRDSRWHQRRFRHLTCWRLLPNNWTLMPPKWLRGCLKR